jgi:hypothetical protein
MGSAQPPRPSRRSAVASLASCDPRGQCSGSAGVTCALLSCGCLRVRSLPRCSCRTCLCLRRISSVSSSRGADPTLRPDHHLVRAHPLARRPSRRTSTPDDLSVPGNLPGLHGALRRLLIRSTGPCGSPFKANSGNERDCLPAGVVDALRRRQLAGRRSLPSEHTRDQPESLSTNALRTPRSTMFQIESSLGPLPSEVSLCSCRSTLSGRAFLLACLSDLAAGLLRGLQRCAPHRAGLAATRLRCFEQQRSDLRALFTRTSRRSSPGRSPPSRITVADSACASSTSPLAPCGTRSPVSLRVSTKLLS